MNAYQPTGRGLCARCGRDVGAHEAGHEYRDPYRGENGSLRGECRVCGEEPEHPIHIAPALSGDDTTQVTNYDAEAEAKARIAELERKLE